MAPQGLIGRRHHVIGPLQQGAPPETFVISQDRDPTPFSALRRAAHSFAELFTGGESDASGDKVQLYTKGPDTFSRSALFPVAKARARLGERFVLAMEPTLARPVVTLKVGSRSVSYPVLDKAGYELPSDFKALLQYLELSPPVDEPVVIAWTLADETNKTTISGVVAIVADPPPGSRADDTSISQLLQLC